MFEIVLLLVLLLVSFLYSSVGHGGASGYIAVLTLAGVSSVMIRPAALILNVFVAGIAYYQYFKAGEFKWKLFYPFAILSVPFAWLGSQIQLDPIWYKRIIGVCLILAVARIFGAFDRKQNPGTNKIPLIAGLFIGAVLGLLSGMIGIGGGIILSPLMLLFRWANMKETAAVSALFIVVNSIAGIAGLVYDRIKWPEELLIWIPLTVAGGFAGAYWGSRKANINVLRNVLAVVLLFAALKLIVI